MSAVATAAPPQFPPTVADAVKKAVENTLASILGDTPRAQAGGGETTSCSGLVGIISFLGEPSWSFSLMLPQDTAVQMARRFAGFDIPFDSPDMGDVVGELANVIAGDIVAQCDARRVKAQMSLPMVARGNDVEMLSPGGLPTLRMSFRTAEGPFWYKLSAARSGSVLGRRPGT